MIKRNDNIRFLLPEKSGLYFLFDKDKNLVYIGRAKNLKIRLLQHYNNYENLLRHNELLKEGIKPSWTPQGMQWAKPFEYLRYSLIPDLKKLHNEELKFIHKLTPILNDTC